MCFFGIPETIVRIEDVEPMIGNPDGMAVVPICRSIVAKPPVHYQSAGACSSAENTRAAATAGDPKIYIAGIVALPNNSATVPMQDAVVRCEPSQRVGCDEKVASKARMDCSLVFL